MHTGRDQCVCASMPEQIGFDAKLKYYFPTLELEEKFPTAQLVLVGDFNTRVGAGNSLFHQAVDIDLDTSLPHFLALERQSKDKHFNTAELRILRTH